MPDLTWLIVLFAMFTFASGAVSIISIRATWDDVNQREIGMIPLYITIILAFVTSLIAALNIYDKPKSCYLPYSGKMATIN